VTGQRGQRVMNRVGCVVCKLNCTPLEKAQYNVESEKKLHELVAMNERECDPFSD